MTDRDPENSTERQLSPNTRRLQRILVIRTTRLEPEGGYTTHHFNDLAKPLPVGDIFISTRGLIISRLSYRLALVIGSYLSLLWLLLLVWPIMLALSIICIIMEHYKIYAIGHIGIPSAKQIWSIHEYPRQIWEIVFARLFLRKNSTLARLWWLVYFYVSPLTDFEQDFCNAWAHRSDTEPGEATLDGHASLQADAASKGIEGQLDGVANTNPNATVSLNETPPSSVFTAKKTCSVALFLDRVYLNAKITISLEKDQDLLRELRIFYRLLKVKRGVSELIIPRELMRLVTVKHDETNRLAFENTGTILAGRELRYLYNPSKAPNDATISKRILDAAAQDRQQGLEFLRAVDRSAIGTVIIVPPVASLILIVIWLAVFLGRSDNQLDKAYVQAVAGTAFTAAGYLVTAGALIIALAAFLDARAIFDDDSPKPASQD